MHTAAAWRAVYLVAQGGLSLALFAALARQLTPASFAVTATAQGVLVIAWSVGDLGLAQAAVSVLPEHLTKTEDRAKALGGAAAAFLIASVFSALMCGLAALFVAHAAQLSMLLIAPAASATVVVSGADGLLRAQGEFQKPIVLVLLSRLGAFAALISAAVSGSPNWACAAMSAGITLGSVGSIRLVLGMARGADWPETRAFIRGSIPLGVAQLFTVGSGRLNTLILGATASLGASAVFETTWRVYQFGQYAVGALATGWAPFLAAAIGRDHRAELIPLLKRSIVLVALAGIVTGCVLLVAGTPIALALAPALGHRAGPALEPLAISTPLTFLGFLLTFVVSASPRFRRNLLPAYGLGAAVNIVLTLSLSEHHGARGAALASAIGLCVSSIYLILVTVRLSSTVGARDRRSAD